MRSGARHKGRPVGSKSVLCKLVCFIHVFCSFFVQHQGLTLSWSKKHCVSLRDTNTRILLDLVWGGTSDFSCHGVYSTSIEEKKRLSGLYVFVSAQEQKYILQESNVASFCLWKIKKQKQVNFNVLLLGNAVNCTPRNEQSIICVVISTEWSTEIIWQSVPSQFAIRIIFLVVFFFCFCL